MIAFYVMRIKAGKMTLSKVPPRWREQVRQYLIDAGRGELAAE